MISFAEMKAGIVLDGVRGAIFRRRVLSSGLFTRILPWST
jgi:hypothetical protein